MIGLGKVWKVVTGGGGTQGQAPLSTIPRDITTFKSTVPEPLWDTAKVAPSETRTAERFVPVKATTVLTTTSGKRLSARIINISQNSVALEAELSDFRPQDIAMVGSRPVAPGRSIALGMVFLFKKPLDAKVCNPDIIL